MTSNATNRSAPRAPDARLDATSGARRRALHLVIAIASAGAIAALSLAGPGCSKRAKEAPPAVRKTAESTATAGPQGGAVGGLAAPADKPTKGKRAKRRRRVAASPKKLAAKADRSEGKDQDDDSGGDGESRKRVATRSWFPETFLFKPLIVTDAEGRAVVNVRVPDRLTTWRVLALAHARNGAQAGTVASFLGTLPVYVEPVVPKRLRAGDVARVPINIVNTSAQTINAQLSLQVSGAATLDGGGAAAKQTIALAARASAVRYATLRAKQPGAAKLLAKLGDSDAVVRVINVEARGRPVVTRRGGTLAAPRTITVTRPAGANLALGRVRVQVFSGALSILRKELAAAPDRGGELADDAFALMLSGRAPKLLATLGDKVSKADKRSLRDLAILATQRALRHARVLSMSSATLLARAALAHPQNPVLERLGKRAVQHITRKQSPDGTCGGQSGWTLQRLLVATADCVRAARSERRVGVRASGAFERNAKRIKDPYTAAAVLATGVTSNTLATRLRKLVLAAIKKRPDGAKVLAVPGNVVRADGTHPNAVEASALAVLALGKDKASADLGAAILAGYTPGQGWGDGRSNLTCFEAALALFRDPLPKTVRVTLSLDGKPVAEQALDRERVREVQVLSAAAGATIGADRRQRYKLSAQPPVAGLGFAFELVDRVPWKKPPRSAAEIQVKAPKTLAVGKPAVLLVAATAPAGRAFRVTLALPAGVQVDRKTLDGLVSRSKLARYEIAGTKVTLHVRPLAPARPFGAALRVIPTLGGTLHSGPSWLLMANDRRFDPPALWTVK